MKFCFEISWLHFHLSEYDAGRVVHQQMNFILTSTLLIFEFRLFSCLAINELKIDNFSNILPGQDIKDKDFLDVDVSSDFLPSITEIFDVSDEQVFSLKFIIINYAYKFLET